MNPLLKRIGEHARRHRDLLDAKFGQTQLSQAQAARIIARIDDLSQRDPQRLKERLKEEKFREFQTRRGGTEARIGIFKSHTRSRVWRAKGLAHRQLAVGWSVLAHNLEWVARRVREQSAKAPLAESA
jgi:hypothetical protein